MGGSRFGRLGGVGPWRDRAGGGAGHFVHLAGEMFKIAAGVQLLHVPQRANAGIKLE